MTEEFDLKAMRKELDKLRAKHGAKSQIGGICSNLIQMIDVYPTIPKERRPMAEKNMWDQVARLGELMNQGTTENAAHSVRSPRH